MQTARERFPPSLLFSAGSAQETLSVCSQTQDLIPHNCNYQGMTAVAFLFLFKVLLQFEAFPHGIILPEYGFLTLKKE